MSGLVLADGSSAPRTGLRITAPPGRCVACGCTEEAACEDPQTGQACAWVDEAQNWCTVCALLFGGAYLGRPGQIVGFGGTEG